MKPGRPGIDPDEDGGIIAPPGERQAHPFSLKTGLHRRPTSS